MSAVPAAAPRTTRPTASPTYVPASAPSDAPRLDGFARSTPGNPFHAAPAGPVSAPPPALPPAPPYGPPPSGDAKAKEAFNLLWHSPMGPSQANKALDLARASAKLPADEKDPQKLQSALNDLYVRAGLSGPAAEQAAKDTYKVATEGKGEVRPDFSKGAPANGAQVRATAEAEAKANTDADVKKSVADIKKDPTGFARNITQIDGDPKTTSDGTSCVPTSILAGTALKDPEKLKDLGARLQSPAGQKEFPGLQQPPYKAAVDALKSGTFSARDVALVSKGMHDGMQYTGADGKETSGMPIARELALNAKFQKIGWTPPAMDRATYGRDGGGGNRANVHANVTAGGAAYDPWPYPGSGGRAMVTEPGAAATQHGRTFAHRFGMDANTTKLEGVRYDGNGGLVVERNVIDGKPVSPPISARYTYDAGKDAWIRDPTATVPLQHADYLPPQIGVPLDQRRGTKVEDI